MTQQPEALAAVVCDDVGALRTAVVRVVMAAGFRVPAVVTSFSEVPPLVLAHAARVAVVALPLTGMTGMRAVQALRRTAPHCEVVLLAPSNMLELAALEAGARALVPDDDLRVLRDVLGTVAAELRRAQIPRPRSQPDVDADAAGSVRTNPSS